MKLVSNNRLIRFVGKIDPSSSEIECGDFELRTCIERRTKAEAILEILSREPSCDFLRKRITFIIHQQLSPRIKKLRNETCNTDADRPNSPVSNGCELFRNAKC